MGIYQAVGFPARLDDMGILIGNEAEERKEADFCDSVPWSCIHPSDLCFLDIATWV